MFGVFVITALKAWNLSLPRQHGHPVNTAKFFGPIGHCINRVPLHINFVDSTWGKFFTSDSVKVLIWIRMTPKGA